MENVRSQTKALVAGFQGNRTFKGYLEEWLRYKAQSPRFSKSTALTLCHIESTGEPISRQPVGAGRPDFAGLPGKDGPTPCPSFMEIKRSQNFQRQICRTFMETANYIMY